MYSAKTTIVSGMDRVDRPNYVGPRPVAVLQREANFARNGIRPASRAGPFFTSLLAEAQSDLVSLESLSSYRAGAVLFAEEEKPLEMMAVLFGQVKLSMNSSDGRRLILRIAVPGEIIGLSSLIMGTPYPMTAEVLHSAYVASVPRTDFLRFLAEHPAAYASVVDELSRETNLVSSRLRMVGLICSAPAKLANLLLEWSVDGVLTELGTRFHMSLTHGEIGQCIGASRETVTRILGDLQRQKTVTLSGSSLTISNRFALQCIARVE